MISLKFIRENKELVQETLKSKKVSFDLDELLDKDSEWRTLVKKCDDLKSIRNSTSKEIAKLKADKINCDDEISSMKEVSIQIKDIDSNIESLIHDINNRLLFIPNIVNKNVPIGKTEEDNVVISENGQKPSFDFEIKDHFQIMKKLNMLDMKRGSKISGSGFPLFVGLGAKFERSIISFMIDNHVNNGYIELFPPFLANEKTTLTTGQLPKFKDDMYYIDKDKLYCISTAEVPITSFYRDEVLSEEDLPSKFVAYSACFRREAGSYGKDTKGLLRVHQFNKVELMKFVKPSNSYDELQLLLSDAEKILKLLGLHYRIVELNSSDLSFSASKCYDIEVWSPAEKKFLEVSSCSNFESFQARRGNIRYRNNSTQNLEFVHTVNGSGLATPRLTVAILEHYQQKDGSVKVPEVLQDYFGAEVIR
ncbi:MAG: serine--tRNA ligase [Candidatus Marinimicrobia bacterium]|nr:serine--tRNA ligase [Candidatus Neomarinimicrobiota bacterium]|tara:strand:- start:1647 stop:2912 length:1266 start_codon:yes stop_codon:yes gene_type:complete